MCEARCGLLQGSGVRIERLTKDGAVFETSFFDTSEMDLPALIAAMGPDAMLACSVCLGLLPRVMFPLEIELNRTDDCMANRAFQS